MEQNNPKRLLNRREFLRVAGAATAMAGLSHFQLLNLTFAAPQDACDPQQAVPDYCNPGEDSDICPDGNTTSSDVCIPEMGEMDECMPDMHEPDICDPAEPDQCEVPPGGRDTCETTPDDVDICPDGPDGDGDLCIPTGAGANPDECIPAVGESDECLQGEPDFCRPPGGGTVEHDICDPATTNPDICFENGQSVVDICEPPPGDPDSDDPNPVTLISMSAQTGMDPATLLTLAGGATAAAVGAAALAKGKMKSKDAIENDE